ncbi:MAG: ComEC/Rec2 family competence protein [candidate division WOR-3 bacterium]|nr:ComEC/Rec2 family competence protein [candidate division WOR-3 bacterium]
MHLTVFKVALSLILGIIFSHYFALPNLVFLFLIIVVGLGFLLKFRTLGYLLIFLLSGFNQKQNKISYETIRRFPFYNQNLNLNLIISDIRFSDYYKYEADIYKLNNKPALGKVFVNTSCSLDYGDCLELSAALEDFNFPQNPELFNYHNYYHQQGYIGVVSIDSASIRSIYKAPKIKPIGKILFKIRRYIHKTLASYLPDETYGLLLGIFLGDKEILDKKLNVTFKDLGLGHLFAVSGLHVSLLCGILLLILMILGIRRKFRLLLLIAFVGFYLALINFRVPAIRASLMTFMALLGRILERKYDSVHGVIIALILILTFWPQALFEISFQLSFITTLAIILGVSKIYSYGILQNISSSIRDYFILPCIVSLSATLGITPLLSYHFFQITPGTFIINLLVIPFLPLIFILGILVLVLNLFIPSLALFYGSTLWVSLKAIVLISEKLAQIPFIKIITPRWEFIIILCYYIIILLFIYWTNPTWRKLLLFSVLILANVFIFTKVFKKETINITFLDTQKGESTVIELPTKEVVIIDAGVQNSILRNYLLAKRIKTINWAIVTHPHYDHYGGFRSLINDFRVQNWLLATTVASDTLYTNLIKEIQKKAENIVVAHKGISITNNDILIEVLYPSRELQKLSFWDDNFDPNNLSIVLRVIFSKDTLLFLGDLTCMNLVTTEELGAQVVKSPHHGSEYIDYQLLINKTKPQYLIVTAAQEIPRTLKENLAPFPKPIKVFNTKTDGAIILKIEKHEMKIKTIGG